MLNMSNSKGITLIALVITIIILLILAGISISAVFGENGLIKRAQSAGEETRGATVAEQVEMWKLEWETSEYVDRKPLTPEEKIKELYDQKLLTDKDIEEYGFIDGDINGDFTYNKKSVIIGSKEIDFNIDENGDNDTDDSMGFLADLVDTSDEQNDEEKPIKLGDKINYKVSNYTGDWRVMWATNKNVYIYSDSPVTDVTLYGKNGYNNGVSILNNEAKKYLDSRLADVAMCLGSGSQNGPDTLLWNSISIKVDGNKDEIDDVFGEIEDAKSFFEDNFDDLLDIYNPDGTYGISEFAMNKLYTIYFNHWTGFRNYWPNYDPYPEGNSGLSFGIGLNDEIVVLYEIKWNKKYQDPPVTTENEITNGLIVQVTLKENVILTRWFVRCTDGKSM